MEELTIKEEEIEMEENFFETNEENNIFVEDGISQDQDVSYEEEFEMDIKMEDEEYLEDSNCKQSCSTYRNGDYDQSYHNSTTGLFLSLKDITPADFKPRAASGGKYNFSSRWQHSLKIHTKEKHKKKENNTTPNIPVTVATA